MYLDLILLIFLPIIFGLAYLTAGKTLYKLLSYALFIVNAILSIKVAFSGPVNVTVSGNYYRTAEILMLGIEVVLIAILLAYSIRQKRKLTLFLVLVQVFVLVYPLIFENGEHSAVLNIDRLSIIMLLIVNIVGSLIVVFAVSYIEEYEHHRHMKSKQKSFFFIICMFLSAMNGLVISDTLAWVYFFWEITTVASFLLIGFNGDKDAYNSAFRAASINLFGGICFGLGNILFREYMDVTTLSQLITHGRVVGLSILPVFLLAMAGFTKAAQVPFQSWLLGAMVAPTPVSALLHSSTMVKAGVYLIIRLSPAYAGTPLGMSIAIYGALIFALCSAMAVSQSNAKRVLAYSTVANLGFIISSAGMGSTAGISAAIILVIFHAVSKALLFLCTGQIEHTINSRDIEDMSGLIRKAPLLSAITVFGIISMILPPFGVLITKWLAIEASAKNPIVVVLIVLGSALTTLYYIKWMGNLVASPSTQSKSSEHREFSIYGPLVLLGIIVAAVSILLIPINNILVSPQITTLLKTKSDVKAAGGAFMSGSGSFNNYIILIVIAVMIILFTLARSSRAVVKNVYMCGENNSEKDSTYFRQGNGDYVEANVTNLYLAKYFSEKYITLIGLGAAVILFISMIAGGLL